MAQNRSGKESAPPPLGADGREATSGAHLVPSSHLPAGTLQKPTSHLDPEVFIQTSHQRQKPSDLGECVLGHILKVTL